MHTPIVPPQGTNFIDRTGQRFGRLIALYPVGKHQRGYMWCCRCDCGTEVSVSNASLQSDKTKSCGCLQRDKSATHHMSSTPEYSAWRSMRARCMNPNAANWENYGGRGIKICPRWLESFKAFFEDMGVKPSPKHSLDRIDNENGNYEPGNCRWATRAQQNANKRTNHLITYNGETRTLAQWAKQLGIKRNTLDRRIIDSGWSVERAFTEPVRRRAS